MLGDLVGRILLNRHRSEFERYYTGILLEDGQPGKPTLEEAKRDFLAFVEMNARLG
jgi:hypothetical protein